MLFVKVVAVLFSKRKMRKLMYIRGSNQPAFFFGFGRVGTWGQPQGNGLLILLRRIFYNRRRRTHTIKKKKQHSQQPVPKTGMLLSEHF